jgi:hypothetical protein
MPSDPPAKEIFVVIWKYYDCSDAGVVRAYADEKRAKADLEMLCKYCDGYGRIFGMETVEYIESTSLTPLLDKVSALDKPNPWPC